MRFSIDKYSGQMEGALKYLLSVIGPEPWEKRIRDLVRLRKDTPLFSDLVAELYPIEIAMADILAGVAVSSDSYDLAYGRGRYDLLAFAASVFEFHLALSAKGKRRLEGMIRDGLHSDKGLGPLRHELSTAIHMMGAGWDVECVDLEQETGVDYVARRNGLEVEVECKSISGDLGRQISKRHAVQAFSAIRGILEEACKDFAGGAMIRVTFPEKLSGNVRQHAELRSSIEAVLKCTDGSCSNESFDVTRVDFDFRRSPFAATQFDTGAIQQFFAERYGIENREMCFVGALERGVIGVSLESKKADRVLQGISRQLRDSAKSQFTGIRPGILAVQLYSIAHDELMRLGRASGGSDRPSTGFDYIGYEVFRGASTAHMLALALRAHEPVVSRGIIRGAEVEQSYQAAGGCYVSTNMSHPLAAVREANPFLSSPRAASQVSGKRKAKQNRR